MTQMSEITDTILSLYKYNLLGIIIRSSYANLVLGVYGEGIPS
jgi:hypothetical protein